MKMKVPSALAGVVLLGCVGIPMAASAQTGVTRAAPQASSDTGGLPQVERPSGPHGIGREGYHWSDSKRPDRFATEAQTHRELMVYFWYPTPQQHADFKGAYFPGAKQMDDVPELRRGMREEFGINWPSIVSGRISSHAMETANAATRPRPFPIAIFS